MNYEPYRPEIRFADLDTMGHVNNAIYLSYFEQARIHFFRQFFGGKWDWRKHGILVARNEIDYKVSILLRDDVRIYVGCKHMGSKSFTLDYRITVERDGQEVVASTGASVLVCFNHSDGKTAPIPDEWRTVFEQIPSVTA
ncbi:MAG: thioesterase family protein [Flavobacteriales bacterium]